jgi:ABC-type branched-subunit amino acid transport system substrate-binding protein
MITRLRLGSRLRTGLVLSGLATLVATTCLFAQESRDQGRAEGPANQELEAKVFPNQVPPSQPGDSGGPPPSYGKTPNTAIPYRRFQEPYVRFFQKPVEFLGAGRDQEPAVAPKTVRIGFFGPVTSAPDADLGQQMLEGVQLVIEQANAAGGYRSIPFELVIRQDLGLWGASSNEMAAFKYEDNVLAVIGSIDGANTHIALRVALKTQMPMVNTATTDPTLTETNIPWILRCMADDRQQGYALAAYVFRDCQIKSVVAFRVNDRYGRTGIIEFRDAARRLGFPLRSELRWNRGERDFTRQLDRIAKIGPEAVVIWGNAADAAAVVKEIRRRKMPVRLFGSDRLASRAFLEAAGQAAEGIAVAASYDPSRRDRRLGAFVEAYTKRFQHAPEAFAAHAYDGANILIGAIRRAGLNSVRIRDTLYECQSYEGVTGPITFDATLNDIGPIYIAIVENGRFSYHEMEFAMGPEEQDHGGAYRAMVQSPPKARSPADVAVKSEDAVRIGCFLPLDEKGQAVIRGMHVAIAEDSDRNPEETPIELVIRDARGAWGENSGDLVDLVFADHVLALVGSTERRGTHLAEMIAAKIHFPVLSLCGADPTITEIPLPWVFCLAPDEDMSGRDVRTDRRSRELGTDRDFALGYDAAALLAERIREGGRSRKELRDALAGDNWHEGLSGTFRFDVLGNRIDTDRPLEGPPAGRYRRMAKGLAH